MEDVVGKGIGKRLTRCTKYILLETPQYSFNIDNIEHFLNAFDIGCNSPFSGKPSIVVIFAPSTSTAHAVQLLIDFPST